MAEDPKLPVCPICKKGTEFRVTERATGFVNFYYLDTGECGLNSGDEYIDLHENTRVYCLKCGKTRSDVMQDGDRIVLKPKRVRLDEEGEGAQ